MANDRGFTGNIASASGENRAQGAASVPGAQAGLVGDDSAFAAFLRGPSARGVSSRGLDWRGFTLEEHCMAAGAHDESVVEPYVLALWRKLGLGEHAAARGGYARYKKQPGMITIIPPGIAPAVRAQNPSSFVLLAVTPTFERAVKEELDTRPEEVRFQTGFYDPTLQHLLTLLLAEAAQNGLLGRLYAEHLAHALTVRLLLPRGPRKGSSRAASALPRPVLQRVLERMHDLENEPDLRELAAQGGYSRGHFLRMFRATTGLTPHRYLLQLRVEKAQRQLALGRASLIEIAADSGFASHSHMSRVFRQLLGVTPSEYRRSL